MRYIELAFFLTPFAIFAIWRLAAPAAGPSPRVVVASAALLLLLVVALLWLRHEGTLPPGTAYVPPTLQDGRIIPGHGAPR
jgi:Family of unknown function (DUF6111)